MPSGLSSQGSPSHSADQGSYPDTVANSLRYTSPPFRAMHSVHVGWGVLRPAGFEPRTWLQWALLMRRLNHWATVTGEGIIVGFMLAGTEFTHKKKKRKSSVSGFEPGSFAPKAITLTVRLKRPYGLFGLLRWRSFPTILTALGQQQTLYCLAH